MDKYGEAFREETHEILSELETALFKLEENPEDRDMVGQVFRAMHTIKGSGAMFGFDDIAAFTHEIEAVFDEVREGKIPVTKDLMDLTLSARDQVRKMVDGYKADETVKEKILESFRKMLADPEQMEEDFESSVIRLRDINTLSVPEAAALCGVSRSTVNNWIHAKKLFARRSGRVYSIQKTDLLLFLEAMGKPLPDELKNEKYAQPLFRSFQHCWDFFGGEDHEKKCDGCVVKQKEMEVCFIARRGKDLQCHKCRYYQAVFYPRIQFIFQMEMPAAVCKGLYFLGANRWWAAICGLPHETFIGLDIENVIHPNSLSEVISVLKKREMGDKVPDALLILVRTGSGERRSLIISVFPLDEPAGSSLILAKSGEEEQ